jgi:hypothetical protein
MGDGPCRWGCDGSGKIRVGESTDKFCTCLIIQRIRDILGKDRDICNPRWPSIPTSPLLSADGTVDKTQTNVLLRNTGYRFVIPHLRLVLASKLRATGLCFRYLIESDERLKNIWVGNESYSNKPKSRRGDEDTVNGLRDLVGGDIDLVIIRLGVLKAKNVEAARILHETLMIRDSLHKPTWLIEEPNDPFGPSYMTYDNNVWDHIAQEFEIIDIPTETSWPTPVAIAHEDDHEASFGVQESETAPKHADKPKVASRPRPSPPPPPPVQTEIVMPGALLDKGRKGWRQ